MVGQEGGVASPAVPALQEAAALIVLVESATQETWSLGSKGIKACRAEPDNHAERRVEVVVR